MSTTLYRLALDLAYAVAPWLVGPLTAAWFGYLLLFGEFAAFAGRRSA